MSGSCTFEAIDGMHEAKLIKAAVPVTVVSLKMKDVTQVNRDGAAYILDTGSPHYVTFCEDTARINLVPDARLIRNSDKYRAEGINVNYVAEQNGNFKIRTYERGVEDETFSCGTGTVAAAIAVAMDSPVKINKPVHFTAPGGKLEVSFENHNDQFTNIWLTGEATRVFDGSVTI
jgi:diaminopimelate epimerase